MRKLFAILLAYSPLAFSSMDGSNLPAFVTAQEINYRLVSPEGFRKLNVTILLRGTSDNEIKFIEIETGERNFTIGSSQLKIDFGPNLKQIDFHTLTNDPVASIFFYIYHGIPRKVECGPNRFEYVQKSVKTTVFPKDEPEVEMDDSYFEQCVEFTRQENDFEQ